MAQDRTEPATPRRRRKAREEGQVARSAELVGAVMLLGFLGAAPRLVTGIGRQVAEYFVRTVGAAGQGAIEPDGLARLAAEGLIQVGRMAGPVMALVLAAALATNVLQVGVFFSAAPLQPKLSRLDPFTGLRRLLTARALLELVKGFLKVAIVAAVGWHYLAGHRAALFALPAAEPGTIAPRVGGLAHAMAVQMVATLAVLAALDYGLQRWQLERSLRMTKQEVKDDLRETEGNPEIRSRVRQRQRETARRRMMADVPRASVVITNPTHYAVALRYELGQAGAPTVVARGQDLIALRIREIAAEHDVPTVEDPPLARSLYQTAEIGAEIPPQLYRAVAEVLAMIWRLDARKRGV